MCWMNCQRLIISDHCLQDLVYHEGYVETAMPIHTYTQDEVVMALHRNGARGPLYETELWKINPWRAALESVPQHLEGSRNE